jgi:release factor glutamine methyltransferase
MAVASARERLADAAARLSRAGVSTPRVDAEWLLAAALGTSRGRVRVAAGTMSEDAAERYEAWISRRAGREPLQYILGTQAFRDLVLRVGPDVLVPRPETEQLVSWALELLPAAGHPALVIDVGTGSGCIACALASERPDLRVVAVDVCPAAVTLARENVAALGLADRVRIEPGDLFSGLAPVRADLIVANPPYVPTDVIDTLAPEVSDHEPRLALDGGLDGLDVMRRLVSEAPRWLRPGAPLLLETFGDEQVHRVIVVMQEAGFVDLATRRDLAGVVRFVSGRSPRPGRAGERGEGPPPPAPPRKGEGETAR